MSRCCCLRVPGNAGWAHLPAWRFVVRRGWWLTAPLERTGTSAPFFPADKSKTTIESATEHSRAHAGASRAQPQTADQVDWPEKRLEGRRAKELLLTMMQAVDRSFRQIHSYTMTLRKQERINGTLLPEQSYFLKVRQNPFAFT